MTFNDQATPPVYATYDITSRKLTIDPSLATYGDVLTIRENNIFDDYMMISGGLVQGRLFGVDYPRLHV